MSNNNLKEASVKEIPKDRMVMCEEYDIVSIDNNLDERGENVFLLEKMPEWKTTAERKGNQWLIVDWDLMEAEEVTFWFERSTYTLSIDLLNKLNNFTKKIKEG